MIVGFLCRNLLAQFRDQSAETLWKKLTAVWEIVQQHTHTYTEALVSYLSVSHIHKMPLKYSKSRWNTVYTHAFTHAWLQMQRACPVSSAHKQISGTVGTFSQDRYHCQLQMREHMSALTGDTKQTWLFSIKPVNLIIRLADFWKKSF